MSEEFEPNIVAFLCNWCSYAGADLAGTSRMRYLPNMSWVSASEGAKFKEVIDETVAKAKEAGPMEQFRRRQINW
jgi:coenzyme F420-reducing hydrogenase delta subunit